MAIYGNVFLNQLLYNIPDMSPEYIQEMSNSIIEEYSYILNENSNLINLLEAASAESQLGKVCTQINVNKATVMGAIKKAGSNITDIIKKFGINKEAREKISIEFSNCCDTIVVALEKGDLSNLKIGNYDVNKVRKGLSLLLFNIVVNSVSFIVLGGLFGPIGQIITAGVIGPVCEESTKQIAVRGGYDVEYTVLFNSFEMYSYVKQITGFGFKLKGALIFRSFALIMHLVNTVIQKVTNKKVVDPKSGEENKEEKSKRSFIGYVVSLLIHSVFNFAGIFNTPLRKLGEKILLNNKK